MRAALLCGLLAAFALSSVVPGAAQNKKKEPLLKTVHGLVQDKAENPISGAIVFLKNLQNKSVKTSFTTEDGHYRFSGLDPNTDYELHAEFNGGTSSTRRLSALDDHKDLYLTLTIAKKK
jgi:Carboxypeptidase regulatory-like domain